MIELRDLSIRAGTCHLSQISLRIPTGSYAVLMGKTGQGKTLLLEAICGLRSVESGRILLDEVDVTFRGPAVRQVGYVPQDLALFRTMTVFEHLALALRIRKVSAPEIRHRVEELAALLNIEHLLKRRPRGLSGGESQRVALGRALSFRPSLLLLDEPLSALDEETRDEIQLLLRTMQSTTGVTTLHVTHHRGEAEALADQLFVLGDGCVRQVLPP